MTDMATEAIDDKDMRWENQEILRAADTTKDNAASSKAAKTRTYVNASVTPHTTLASALARPVGQGVHMGGQAAVREGVHPRLRALRHGGAWQARAQVGAQEGTRVARYGLLGPSG